MIISIPGLRPNSRALSIKNKIEVSSETGTTLLYTDHKTVKKYNSGKTPGDVTSQCYQGVCFYLSRTLLSQLALADQLRR